jgi:hypothetical protein
MVKALFATSVTYHLGDGHGCSSGLIAGWPTIALMPLRPLTKPLSAMHLEETHR